MAIGACAAAATLSRHHVQPNFQPIWPERFNRPEWSMRKRQFWNISSAQKQEDLLADAEGAVTPVYFFKLGQRPLNSPPTVFDAGFKS